MQPGDNPDSPDGKFDNFFAKYRVLKNISDENVAVAYTQACLVSAQ